MKLLRYGLAGQERPGLLDGKDVIRNFPGRLPAIDGSGEHRYCAVRWRRRAEG